MKAQAPLDARISSLSPAGSIRLSGDSSAWVTAERSGDGSRLRFVRHTPSSFRVFAETSFLRRREVKAFYESEGLVHLESAHGDGRTLCGLALEGECDDDPESDGAPACDLSAHHVVTCPDCAAIIRHCRRVPTSAKR